MATVVVDCTGIRSSEEFWDAYVRAVGPENSSWFGRNLDAFWDAVSAGGPGWPGEGRDLRFIHAATLIEFDGGNLYRGIKQIAAASEFVKIDIVDDV